MAAPFPYLDEYERIEFPPSESAPEDDPLAVGGNLSPGMLLSAYEQGVFPWFNPGDEIYWWNPDPRFILFPENLHISRRFARVMKKHSFCFTLDTAFNGVITHCARIYREGQEGTWITSDMIKGYSVLHELGYAHSAEVWLAPSSFEKFRMDDVIIDLPPFEGSGGMVLAGGLYGLSLGSCFFGESMFSLVSGASRTAFILLTQRLRASGFTFIDCQMETPHMKALGGESIPRKEYMRLLEDGLKNPDPQNLWMKKAPPGNGGADNPIS